MGMRIIAWILGGFLGWIFGTAIFEIVRRRFNRIKQAQIGANDQKESHRAKHRKNGMQD